MTRTPQDVTKAELAVLRVLWDCGRVSIREITERVYPGNSESDYATVKKLLSRLERKRLVVRIRERMAHEFEANISSDDLINARLQGVVDDLCGGSRTPLLMNLLQSDEVNDSQRKRLKKLIDEIDASNAETKPPKSKKSGSKRRTS